MGAIILKKGIEKKKKLDEKMLFEKALSFPLSKKKKLLFSLNFKNKTKTKALLGFRYKNPIIVIIIIIIIIRLSDFTFYLLHQKIKT